MTKPEKQVGYRIEATVISLVGSCHAGHKVGDKFEVDCHDTGGMCGFLYHDIFPALQMLQFGGGYPAERGNPDVMQLECPNRTNVLKIELRRIKQ